MTERLYLADSHLFSCDATVTACRASEDGGCLVTLDRTVFFPNKGGQPCDTGRMDGVRVTACDEEGDELLHRTERPLAVGARVQVSIDEDRRLDIMQQHTGEHLLSYCAYRLFGAANVGFHCALDYATLDLDRPLTADEIRQMEQYANRLAAENAPVTATVYATEEEIRDLPLRKHAEGLTAPIRLVEIRGSDLCTCCAPHVRATGEIGQLKITEQVNYKGGMRLTFLCGLRALAYAERLEAAMQELARRFSTAWENVPAAVEKQGAELASARRLVKKYEAELDAALAARLNAGAKTVRGTRLVVALSEDMDAKRLRPLAAQLMQGKTLAALFSRCGGQVYYVLSTEGTGLDMGELAGAVNAATGGKGGGRGSLAQGSAPAGSALADTVQQLEDYFTKRLNA